VRERERERERECSGRLEKMSSSCRE
jgi:hypothetical protein